MKKNHSLLSFLSKRQRAFRRRVALLLVSLFLMGGAAFAQLTPNSSMTLATDPDQAGDKLPSMTQVIYSKPNTTHTLYAVTKALVYYRWYNNLLVSGNYLNGLSLVTQSGYGAPTVISNDGVFYYRPNANDGNNNSSPTGSAMDYTVPGGINTTYPERITSDVGNYFSSDLSNSTTGTYNEPKLSYRNHFEIYPAWKIAQEIDNAFLGVDQVFEYHKLHAPAGTLEGGGGTRLRLTPMYYPDNYFYTENQAVSSLLPDADPLLDDNALFQGATFKWFRRTTGSADQTKPSSETANAGGTLLNGTKFLQIETGSKTAGEKESYDVYVYGPSALFGKLIATFDVTYENVNVTGPKLIGEGTTAFSAEPVESERLEQEYYAGALWKGKGRKLLTSLNFDRPGPDTEETKTATTYSNGLGSSPLSPDQTSYGFVDPSDSWYQYHPIHVKSGFWSEYSFPRAINAEGTQKTMSGEYGWSYAGVVYDLTKLKHEYLDAKNIGNIMDGKGNMLYVDAAEEPGTFAKLKFENAMCSGTTLYFSAFVTNLNQDSENSSDAGNQDGGEVRPNLVFKLKDSDGKVFHEFYTGDIGRGNVGKWYEVGFSFVIDGSTPGGELTLEIQNNGLSTQGNDFALDDISVFRANPKVKAVRDVGPLCLPSIGVVDEDLSMTMAIDLTEMEYPTPTGRKLYYYLHDSNGKSFPQKSEDDEVLLYENSALSTTGTAFYYGYFDLDNEVPKYTEVQLAALGTILYPYILVDDDGNLLSLNFVQTIPTNVLNGDASGPVLGEYELFIGENYDNLISESCRGNSKFSVLFDNTEIDIVSDVIVNGSSSICAGIPFDITAISYSDKQPLYVYYDWYHGPLADFEDSQMEKDLKAFRYYYPKIENEEQIAVLISAYENNTLVLPKAAYPGTDYDTVDELGTLLNTIRGYLGTSTGKLELYKRIIHPVILNAGDNYYLTVIPCSDQALLLKADTDIDGNKLEKNGRYIVKTDDNGEFLFECDALQEGDNCDPATQAICGNPAQIVLTAIEGPSVVFGEVSEAGTFKMNYPYANGEYVYTVRLPEEVYANEEDRTGRISPGSFVVPLAHFNDVRVAEVRLVDVTLNGASISGTKNVKIENVHLGIIDAANRNALDQTAQMTVTQMPDASALTSTTLPNSLADFALPLYWDLDATIIDDANISLRSYPLIYNSPNFYDVCPAFDVTRKGTPFSKTDISDADLNNNIALEILAEKIPAAYLTEGKFIPNAVYEFVLVATSEPEIPGTITEGACEVKTVPFQLKVVPNHIYWDATAKLSDSWHNDGNWEYDGNSSFAPLRSTNVTMNTGSPIYPTLNNEIISTVNSVSELRPSRKETDFIEFDYNFVPNSADLIHFEMSSELGNQYFLDYGKAEVDLKLNTLRWYGLSAPLRDMYSGDYMFEQANPLVQIRLFNEINPESKAAAYVGWTKPFNNTNTPKLAAGLGYSLTIGNKYYPCIIPDEGTASVESQAVAVADRMYGFPKEKMLFNFYHEITRALLTKTEEIAAGGRDYGHRFVYETGDNVVPPATLATISLENEQSGNYVVVGNPLMSHIDFEKFYDANKDYIQSRFFILNGGNSYVTYDLNDEIATDPGMTVTSIPPMQTFVVELIEGSETYISDDKLVVNKGMGVVNANPTAVLRSSMAKANELRIKATKGTISTEAVVVLSENASNGYVSAEDSRRLIPSDVKTAPSVYTIVDDVYLDVNRLKALPESLPIGISEGKGINTITITGLDNIAGHQFSFLDAEVGVTPIVGDAFEYTFDNSGGDVVGRFYLLSQDGNSGSTSLDEFAMKNISVYASNNSIHVVALDGSSIEDMTIYGVDGQIIYQQSNATTSHIAVPIAVSNTVLLVKARTNSASTVVKIINK